MSDRNISEDPVKTLGKSINDTKTRYIGYFLVILFLTIFVVWGNIVPLKSAAIATGTVSVAGNKKTVQHADGGTVSGIYIKDGDSVKAGQVVVSLDDTDAQTDFLRLKKQTTQLIAELTRWQAEQQLDEYIDVNDWQQTYRLSTSTNEKLEDCPADGDNTDSLLCQFRPAEIENAVAEQQNILDARLAEYNNSLASMQHQISESENKERENQNALDNIEYKRKLISAELRRNRNLEEQGLITRQRVFDLESDLSDVRSSKSEVTSAIDIAQEQRSRLQADLLVLKNTQKRVATEKVASVRNDVDEAIAKTRLTNKSLQRLSIRSPIDGTVIGTQVNTIGSVIAPGDTLMEIVPLNATLLIESQVNPIDRDSVSVGQVAVVRFSAFDKRSTKPTSGTVTLISADRVIDPATNAPYYKTIIELSEDPTAVLNGATIYPGMQADVLIETGEQTFIQYLLSPVSKSFRHAFRES